MNCLLVPWHYCQLIVAFHINCDFALFGLCAAKATMKLLPWTQHISPLSSTTAWFLTLPVDCCLYFEFFWFPVAVTHFYGNSCWSHHSTAAIDHCAFWLDYCSCSLLYLLLTTIAFLKSLSQTICWGHCNSSPTMLLLCHCCCCSLLLLNHCIWIFTHLFLMHLL